MMMSMECGGKESRALRHTGRELQRLFKEAHNYRQDARSDIQVEGQLRRGSRLAMRRVGRQEEAIMKQDKDGKETVVDGAGGRGAAADETRRGGR
jgi:hypothetical protein